MLGNSRQFLRRFPLLGMIRFLLIFLSSGPIIFLISGPSRSLLLALCLVLSPCALCGILLGIFLRSFFCPVHTFRLYLSRMTSLPSHPRTLFVSPWALSRPLSKNALSFFIRDIIAEAYSFRVLAFFFLVFFFVFFPSSLFSSCACGSLGGCFLGLSASCSFSLVLEATSWSSASVFTSFYTQPSAIVPNWCRYSCAIAENAIAELNN